MSEEVPPDTSAEHELSGLAFLVGRWRGVGEWGGKPFTCRTQIDWFLGRFLEIRVAAEQDGRASHAERVAFHAAGDRIVAMLYPDRGEVQRFEVQVPAPGEVVRLVFTPPSGSALSPQRWTIRRTETGYEETFEIAHGGGVFTTSVTCAYVPENAA